MDLTTVRQLNQHVEREALFVRDLRTEINKMMVGQQKLVDRMLIALLADGHILLEGVPGLAKTLLVKTTADAIQGEYARIQFTPDLLPADLVGTQVYNPRTAEFSVHQGPIFANLVLADEINRATPKTQSALLEAMQEKTVTVANHTYPLPEPFFVLATQNPLEMEGTYPLPEAQLDRFLFKVNVPFPTAAELDEILARTTGEKGVTIQSVADGERITAMQKMARQVPVPSHVSSYISRLIVATHPNNSPAPLVQQFVRYGASPRGAQALILGGKITALLAGRYNVSFEDVQAVAAAALRHRLILNFEAQAQGITTDVVVQDLLGAVARE